MALLAVGRRLPVLRDLTALAVRREASGAPSRLNLFAAQWSSSSDSKTRDASGSSASDPAKGVVGDGGLASSGEPTSPPTAPESTSQPTTVEEDDGWTEVVHSSGQLYYWNQRTGETTQLGQPKPESGRSGGSSGGGGSGAGGAGGQTGPGGGPGAGPINDPRAEAPMEDRTGTYASLGLLVGAFLGWVSQFV